MTKLLLAIDTQLMKANNRTTMFGTLRVWYEASPFQWQVVWVLLGTRYSLFTDSSGKYAFPSTETISFTCTWVWGLQTTLKQRWLRGRTCMSVAWIKHALISNQIYAAQYKFAITTWAICKLIRANIVICRSLLYGASISITALTEVTLPAP